MSFAFFIYHMKMLMPFSQDYGKDLRKVNYVAVWIQETVHTLHEILFIYFYFSPFLKLRYFMCTDLTMVPPPPLHEILLNNNDYFLSINSWLALDSISCFINVIFLFQDPIQATTRHLVVMFSLPSLTCYNFFSLSCFSWLWESWGVLARYPVEWVCLWFFTWLTGVMFWKGHHRDEVPFLAHHIIRGTWYHMISRVMLTCIIWSQWCLPSFSMHLLCLSPYSV